MDGPAAAEGVGSDAIICDAFRRIFFFFFFFFSFIIITSFVSSTLALADVTVFATPTAGPASISADWSRANTYRFAFAMDGACRT